MNEILINKCTGLLYHEITKLETEIKNKICTKWTTKFKKEICQNIKLCWAKNSEKHEKAKTEYRKAVCLLNKISFKTAIILNRKKENNKFTCISAENKYCFNEKCIYRIKEKGIQKNVHDI